MWSGYNPDWWISRARMRYENPKETKYLQRENETLMWGALFMAVNTDNDFNFHDFFRERSPRQKEVQRLWQQRGLLERTKANLKIVEDMIYKEGFPEEAMKLNDAYRIVNARIAINMNAAATVKERIPSCK